MQYHGVQYGAAEAPENPYQPAVLGHFFEYDRQGQGGEAYAQRGEYECFACVGAYL